MRKLENLADHQKHLLIQRGEHVDELKEIWRKKWGMEYPYWTDWNGNIKKVQ